MDELAERALSLVEESFIAASGPGGQNVNKVATAVQLRLDVFALFGLQMGEVHVLRNAGGVVTDDVVRSLTISQRKLQTREILLMQHAGCGLATFTDDEFSEELADEVEIAFAASGTDLEYLPLAAAAANTALPVTNILVGQDEVGAA